jgi:hypothetical protein
VELLIDDRSRYVRDASHGAPKVILESARKNIFFSYSRSDEKWVRRLRTHLAPLMRSRDLTLWDDEKLAPGKEWKEQIGEAIAKADLVLLVVSPNYLASNFISNTEFPAILAALEQRGVKVAWLAASPALYQDTDCGISSAERSVEALGNCSRFGPCICVDRTEDIFAGRTILLRCENGLRRKPAVLFGPRVGPDISGIQVPGRSLEPLRRLFSENHLSMTGDRTRPADRSIGVTVLLP